MTLNQDASIHTQVWKAYRNSAEDVRYYIGIDGKSLRNNRNLANYDSEFPDIDKRTRQALKKAESIISSLSRVLSP